MLYLIENKYYIRVAPMRYTEVKLIPKDNDVVISVTNNRLLANGNMDIKEINFQEQKETIKASLQNDTKEVSKTSIRSSKYRKRA